MTNKNVLPFATIIAVLSSYHFVAGGMDEFLRDTMYSIQSSKDDGALTITETKWNSYKMVTTEKWNELDTQKWFVNDFQSVGKYDFTPFVHNTSTNVVTFQFTKNVYTHKRQWKVIILDVKRYQIQNPESGYCLTNMGLHEQVDEIECDNRNPSNQIWKFRLLKKVEPIKELHCALNLL